MASSCFSFLNILQQTSEAFKEQLYLFTDTTGPYLLTGFYLGASVFLERFQKTMYFMLHKIIINYTAVCGCDV